MSNNNNSWFRNLFRRRPTAQEERRQQAQTAQNEATQRLAEARAAQQTEMAADRAAHQQARTALMREARRPPVPPAMPMEETITMAQAIRQHAPPVGLPAENRRALFPPRRAAQAAQPQAAQTAVAATVGVAFEIHDAFDNFKMAKFMDIIRREITNNPPPENMSIYFQNPRRPLTALFEYIENREQITQLMTIQSTIISYPGYDTNRQNVIDVIKFVVTQPEEFITAYIQTLITDCMRAYSTGRTQSCVKGMYERVFFSIRDTVATVCLDQMQGTGPAPLCKPVYIELFECFYETWPKEGPGGLNEMTSEWYGDGERVSALSPENRIEDFVNFVRGKIEDPARFRQAEASIRKYAREDLQNMGLFGGKRRNKRSVKRKYKKQTNKRTINRNKKTMKRRR